MSIPFLLDEKPTVVPGGSAGERSGGARKVPYGAARSNSERAAPSACVGKRFSGPQIVWNRSTRRAGARGGARVGRPRWLRILMITGGSSMSVRAEGTGDDLQSAAAVRAVFDVDVEDPFEQSGPTHARRLSLGRGVIGRGRGGTLCRSGNDFTAQLGVGRQNAMEAACPEPVERDQM